MVAKPGFEEVVGWMEDELDEARKQLACYEAGMRMTGSVRGLSPLQPPNVDDNRTRLAARVDHLIALITKHSKSG